MGSLINRRRTVLKAVVNIAGFAAATRTLQVGSVGTQVLAQSTGESKKTEDKGSTLILLGTQGGPGVTLTRSQTANVLVVGDRQYLIDCGYGTVRALAQAGLGFNNISNIFMTHLHNDHTSDLAALLSLKWTSGRAAETYVHGPFGTAAMVRGAIEFFKADTEIRIVNEGRTVRPESLFHGKIWKSPESPRFFATSMWSSRLSRTLTFRSVRSSRCRTGPSRSGSISRTVPLCFPATRPIAVAWLN
jgi:hypothetical protein